MSKRTVPAYKMGFEAWREAYQPDLEALTWMAWLIHQEMDGAEWSPDTLDVIADALRGAGLDIMEPWEEEDEE